MKSRKTFSCRVIGSFRRSLLSKSGRNVICIREMWQISSQILSKKQGEGQSQFTAVCDTWFLILTSSVRFTFVSCLALSGIPSKWQCRGEVDDVASGFALGRVMSELLRRSCQETILALHREFSRRSTNLCELERLR